MCETKSVCEGQDENGDSEFAFMYIQNLLWREGVQNGVMELGNTRYDSNIRQRMAKFR